MIKTKSPGRLSKAIDLLELEEIDDGIKVTIYYRHHYLNDPNNQKAELLLKASDIEETGTSCTITSYFHEIGIMLGLEDSGKTVDWKMMKEVADEFNGKYDPDNIVQVCQIPGRVFWRAEGYR